MSVIEEKDQEEPEIRLIVDNMNPEPAIVEQKVKEKSTKDFLRRTQRPKRTSSPLSFFREDLSQLKEDFLNVFRDSGTETETQAGDKPVSGTLDLLKEDLSQFKEDVTSVFSSSKVKDTKSADLKSSQTSERTMNPLSFLKDDFSSIFRLSLTTDRDPKEVSDKIKVSEAKSTDGPSESLLDTDQKTSQIEHDDQGEDKPVSGTLDLLKEDLSQFKEDVTSVFSSSKVKDTKSVDPKSSQTSERTMNPLSFLKDDFSSIFRLSLTTDRDPKEGSAKIKVSEAKSTDGRSESLLDTDQKTSQIAHDNQGGDKPVSGTLDLLKEDLSQFKEDVTSVFSSSKVKDTKSVDPESSQTSERTMNPLSALKDDISSIFRLSLTTDRDPKEGSAKIKVSEAKSTDGPSESLLDTDQKTSQIAHDNQAGDKPVSGTLDLLKEDLSQFQEDVTSVFSSSKVKDTKSADLKSSQTSRRTMNPLSFLKDDFSSIFRLSLTTDREPKIDSSKIKDSEAKSSDEALESPLETGQKTSQQAYDNQGEEKAPPGVSEEPMDGTLNVNLETEKVQPENMNNKADKPEKMAVDISVPQEEPECHSDPQCSEETLPSVLTDSLLQTVTSKAERESESNELGDKFPVVPEEDEEINTKIEEEKEEKEVKQPAETLLWESLSAEISLFNLRDQNQNRRDHDGEDLWFVKNYACYLTLDPNTANSEIKLTDGNRIAKRVWSDHRPPYHLDRFKKCPQILCREGLLDSAYWEVVWSGGADIGVTYNKISRDGDTGSCLLGHNKCSWSLECSEGNYTPCYNNKRFKSSSPQPFTHKVGVFLDWPAGTLSFYCISKDNMIHLHTFTSTFSEPLYPGFWVWAYDGSVSLRQVELDWERLLR